MNGITWLFEPVSKRVGPNDSNKIVWREDAQIPSVTNLDAARKAIGDDAILASLNGTSWRVMAQDVARQNDRKMPIEELRERVMARLKGIRSSGPRVREIVRYPSLTNIGALVELGDNAAANLAALIDNGYAEEMARKLLKL